MENKEQQNTIELSKAARKLWSQRRSFYKVWILTFVLSCIWILPQPRYYITEVKLAPETGGDDAAGGLSSLASSFGFNIGGLTNQDAIYPMLYPELFQSPEFIVGLFGIEVTTKDGNLTTDYFSYIKYHQKKNLLIWPFTKVMIALKSLTESKDDVAQADNSTGVDAFRMSRRDYGVMESVMQKMVCAIDEKTNVVSIRVKDQDALISAMMADSVKKHLQDFIIAYRTSKAAEDVSHYQMMRDDMEEEYKKVMRAYSLYCDAHQNIILQSFQSERDKLENELMLRQNALAAMESQLQATKVKLQEKTPAFTTLKSATVPVKPAGPKRMLFVLTMLILVTIAKSMAVLREELKKTLVIYGNK